MAFSMTMQERAACADQSSLLLPTLRDLIRIHLRAVRVQEIQTSRFPSATSLHRCHRLRWSERASAITVDKTRDAARDTDTIDEIDVLVLRELDALLPFSEWILLRQLAAPLACSRQLEVRNQNGQR